MRVGIFGYLSGVVLFVVLAWVFCVVDGELDLFRLLVFVVVLGFFDEITIKWNWRKYRKDVDDDV